MLKIPRITAVILIMPATPAVTGGAQTVEVQQEEVVASSSGLITALEDMGILEEEITREPATTITHQLQRIPGKRRIREEIMPEEIMPEGTLLRENRR
jgi:hypothetical protein